MDVISTAQYLHVENLNTHQVLTVSPLNSVSSSCLPANWGKGAFHIPVERVCSNYLALTKRWMNKVIFSATIEAAILDGKNNEC